MHVDQAPNLKKVALKSDPTRIRQVIFNLVSNAIKFTERGGVRVNFNLQGDDGHVKLCCDVEDTGVGIPADKIDCLFDRFTQADCSTTRKYGGSGLGLAICQQLVDLMGGTITASSEEGRGSCFSVSWPVETAFEKANGSKAAQSPQLCAETTGTLHILLVEDNPINQRMIARMLEKQGWIVHLASNGIEAVTAAMSECHDAILMDVHMPEMDGLTATREIRSRGGRFGRLPIIALTADAMSGDREKFLAAGMSDYVSKPINLAYLVDAVLRHTGDLTVRHTA